MPRRLQTTESPYFTINTYESRMKARYLSDLTTLFFSKLARAHDAEAISEEDKEKLRMLLERIFEVKDRPNKK
jgi:hypothetical protein